MLFNSWVFAIFLPLVLLGYYALDRRRQNLYLIAASYFFYGWWDWRFCSLLLISTIVDYAVARGMAGTTSTTRRKLYLLASCVTNLGILGFFKYFNFFVDSADYLLRMVGLQPDMPTLHVILPVGISFYTFQTMSYTIDVYRGKIAPTRNLAEFALYVSFFPQLVAGPIERATRLLPQIQRQRVVTYDHLSTGTFLILLGLFRKVAIADGVAPLVNQLFANPDAAGSWQLLIGLYLFSLQIYGDFAGYSDIARGTARLLGFELMENFQHPYFSTSITEFWRRWHVSLSSWLRDYLYIPLGGNRFGTFMTYRNLMLTMLLGGLWHGAAWTFVVWGGLHGLYLAGHKLLLGDRAPQVDNRPRTFTQWPRELAKALLTFHLVALTWIFFRAPDFDTAWTYLTRILAASPSADVEGLNKLLVAIVLMFGIDWIQYRNRNHTALVDWHWLPAGLVYAGMVLAIFMLRSQSAVPFIYFQF